MLNINQQIFLKEGHEKTIWRRFGNALSPIGRYSFVQVIADSNLQSSWCCWTLKEIYSVASFGQVLIKKNN